MKKKPQPKLKRRIFPALFPFTVEKDRCYLNAVRAMLYAVKYRWAKPTELTYIEGWLKKDGQPVINHGWIEMHTPSVWYLIDPSRPLLNPEPSLENYINGHIYTYGQVVDHILQAAKFAKLINLPITPESIYKTKLKWPTV